jgi:hypothetical protein
MFSCDNILENISLKSVIYKMDRRVRFQSGRGIGGIFSSLFRMFKPMASSVVKSAVPLLKKVAKSKFVRKTIKDVGRQAKRTAIRTAVDALEDVASGQDPSKKFVNTAKKISRNTLKNTAQNLSADYLNKVPKKRKAYVKKGMKSKQRKSIYE